MKKRKLTKLTVTFFSIMFATALITGCPNSNTPGTPGETPEPTPSTDPTDGMDDYELARYNLGLPRFSPIGGFYKEKQTVSIKALNSTAIYYTILKQTYDENGNWDEEAWKKAVAESKPTETSTKYEGEFEVSEDCIIRAMSVTESGETHYSITCFDFDLDRSNDTDSQAPLNPESEEWRDQTIYFILTDRFWNGDTSNDKIPGLTDQNGKAYDETITLAGQPASGYQGGDIQGVIDKLDYIQNMGFTAIWLTPPVKCQVAESNYHGFHGYWASDMTAVDPHMGSTVSEAESLKVYQNFVKEAHKRGMYVIQDIVVNHFGDYQKNCTSASTDGDGEIKMKDFDTYTTDGITKFPTSYFYLEPASVPYNHPEQLPWALNNLNDLTAEEYEYSSFYHYYSGISDYTNKHNIYTHSSSDLDDLKTENPVVRNLLRGYFRYWIDKVGLDGYRIDTAKYVEPDFFEDFINSTDCNNMGVREYGLSKGKHDFIDFGEAWDQSETLVGSYTKDSSGNKRMDSMIYFPLRFTMTDAISSGGKTNGLSATFNVRMTGIYDNPNRLVTFVDNHDTDRWGQTMKGNIELQKAAYNIIYTITGVPQVYYGSEQGFDGQCRQAMFKGGFKDEGTVNDEDYFYDYEHDGNEWYAYFTNLNKMRKENRVFRYNLLKVLQDTDSSAGVFAYSLRETVSGDDSTTITSGEKGTKAIFVMNTANTDKILDATDISIKPKEKYVLVPYDFINATPSDGTALVEEFVVGGKGKNGNAKFLVPANSTAIYILEESGVEIPTDGAVLSVSGLPTENVIGNTVSITGLSDTTGTVKLILNGDYTLATEYEVQANVEFTKEINIASYSNGIITVELAQTVNGITTYSPTESFTIMRPYKLIAKVSDPSGDDNGVGVAKGKLLLPTEKSWKGQFDFLGADVYRSGNDLRIGLRMKAISRSWDPTSNFFDHVVLYMFVADTDASTGCEYHSKNNYKLPEEFGKWDYMFQCNGWGQSFYSSTGADKDTLGKASTPSANNTPAVNWDYFDELAGEEVILQDLSDYWTDYNPEIGDEWEDKPGMIWITLTAGALGYPSDISGYKIFFDNYDFDMGSPRGIVEGDSVEWKFGTGELTLEETPKVVDEIDTVISIPTAE